MLNCIQTLIQTLNDRGIRYCHWKSNFYLKDALDGIGDLDLLIARQNAYHFESIIAELGFKRALDRLQTPNPSIHHFYGLDHETGKLIHLHVYYRIITGETLIKNYSFPVENLLLEHPRFVDEMPLPPKSAELMIFTLRMILKHASFLEYLMLRRSHNNLQNDLRNELKDLVEGNSDKTSQNLLVEYLPSVDPILFSQCLDCLKQDSSFFRYFGLATKLRQQLKPFNRFSATSEWILRGKLFAGRVVSRLWGSGKSKCLTSGGAIVAFVGAEATGKSTLVRETSNWLGEVFEVYSVHLGKPSSTLLSILPNLLLPMLRSRFAQDRVSVVQSNPNQQESKISLLYAIRSVLLAWDRYQLALKIRRDAVNGKLVICDRYPSTVVGAMDSARLIVPESGGLKNNILRYLANLEHDIYKKIPPADIIIRLSVPVDVAMERNQNRQKHEDEDYVLRRHTTSVVPSFPKAKTLELNSNQSLPETLSTIRHLLWQIL
jgi:thymidylate kinase